MTLTPSRLISGGTLLAEDAPVGGTGRPRSLPDFLAAEGGQDSDTEADNEAA